ncbi:hypothetical protein CEP52_003047 [Fusarium oligoseptatum]|uniref:3-hydroxyisobutyrate dehydrogenase n=1 Tax=Fusarium oligoseptatum TaxID=2604345 RepID=A0A428UAW9_9HYPO|nr:hypothetical protein CEP52_003047 [Fusarium oligoseptatum]
MAAQNNASNDSPNGVNSKSFGFIGLGIMGWGMAKNLRAKIPTESVLNVCEINKARLDEFISSTPGRIQICESPLEVVQSSDVIITMLPRGEHVLQVFTNPKNDLLLTASGTKTFIDCSTIDVKNVKGSGRRGGKVRPGSSTPKVFDTIKPILEKMGKPENIFHCGGSGAGLATKLINNYLSAINMIGVCEGMNMGRLYGLDPVLLAGVINSSTGMSRNSREQNPVKGVSSVASSATDFEGGFSTELCHGVLQMSMELSEQLGAKSMLAPVVRSMYDCAVQSEKCQGKDFRSIYRLFSEEEGQELPVGSLNKVNGSKE